MGIGQFHGEFDWPRRLRDFRRRRRVSQRELAHRSGVSLSAVRAYESGDRHPSREALIAIIDSLGMPVEQANPVLAGAGYAIDWQAILNERYEQRDVPWFAAQVQQYTWPVFVTNQSSDLIAANHPFRRLVGIPFDELLPRPEKWNFIATASDPEFAGRLENWDEAMRFMIGLGKADPRWQINPERQAPPVNDPFQRFLNGDPQYITRLLNLWQQSEPVAHTTRMTYAIRWRHPSGSVMRFTATMHVADVWQELSWHDWIPQDAETMALLAG
jgi:transcriptional regulator with XRE-family HTH domain